MVSFFSGTAAKPSLWAEKHVNWWDWGVLSRLWRKGTLPPIAIKAILFCSIHPSWSWPFSFKPFPSVFARLSSSGISSIYSPLVQQIWVSLFSRLSALLCLHRFTPYLCKGPSTTPWSLVFPKPRCPTWPWWPLGLLHSFHFFPVWTGLVLYLFPISLTSSLSSPFLCHAILALLVILIGSYLSSLLFSGPHRRVLVKLEKHALLLLLSASSTHLLYYFIFLTKSSIFLLFLIFNAYKAVLYSAKSNNFILNAVEESLKVKIRSLFSVQMLDPAWVLAAWPVTVGLGYSASA